MVTVGNHFCVTMKLLRLSGHSAKVSRSFFCLSNRQVQNPFKVSTQDQDLRAESDNNKLSSTKVLPSNSSSPSLVPKQINSSETLTSSVLTPPVENVVLFFRPTQKVIDLDVQSTQNQMSIFFSHRGELVDVQFSENFKQVIKSIHDTEEQNRKSMNRDEPSLASIDELLWKEMKCDKKQLPSLYMKLAKARLSGLVVVTTMAGYALAPGAFDPLTFLLVSLGTGLTSASANAINQFLEVPFDSQMHRTKNRPLVKGVLSPEHAVGFAAISGLSGAAILGFGVNPLTACLGVFNLALYTAVYTPMKRHSIANTWVGSIVGAVPPLMGWAAATGMLNAGAWTLAAIMFAWQFPHFCALSWNLRSDYSRAGYRMMSVVNPDLCRRTAFRYSIGMTGLCTLVPYFGITTWIFAIDSLPLNAWLAYLGYQFYHRGDSKSSRKLFRFSLIHLPALIVLMLISKKQYGEVKQTVDAPSNVKIVLET